MSNIDTYKEYILDTVIAPLERMMGSEQEEVNLWEKYSPLGGFPKKDSLYKSVLHTMMVTYYDKYLNGDVRLCRPNMENVRWHMKHTIDDDDQFGAWASEQDLIISAEGWGKNMQRIPETKRIYQYFYVLELLLQKDCQQDWNALSKELKEMLFKSEVCADYKTDEVLCVLHAFTMIMRQEWSKEKKTETLELMRTNWLFLKHYYSVMTRHIIGVKWTSFRKVAETVMTASQSFKPHLHIFYCGLMDCVDELHLDRAKQRRMDKVILQMQEELNRCEPSELLYELCDTLFPEDFQRMLREHRPKSYKEVENESHRKDELIQQMKDQKKHLQDELDRTKDVLKKMIMSAIPIKEVDAELEQYPPSIAWNLLSDLGASPVLNNIDAWRDNYPTLLEKYRKLLYKPIAQQKDLTDAMLKVAERPANSYNYAAGAVHDDKRQQLMLGEDKDRNARQKRLRYE